LSLITLKRYIAAKKVPSPSVIQVGGMKVRPWTEQDIVRVQGVLPKIKNGRKTRYSKPKTGKKK
jgi:hypothetical protein